MAPNLLTDTKTRNTSFPDVKSLNDDEGLSVRLFKSAKKFQFRYTRPMTKKINNIILGEYPSLTLKSAREIAQGFREMVTKGIDPGNQHQDKLTFADTADKYFENIAMNEVKNTIKKNRHI